MNRQSLPLMQDGTAWQLVFAAWLIAAVSTLGALFFGEVMRVPTCVLCWYQRIFMFPLALILPLGLFPFDRRVVRYALPLAAIGGLIAVYHVLLVAGVVPEDMQPCTQGVPCKEQVIVWLGFLTIPLMAAMAFAAIVILLGLVFFRSPK
jgi:disulfide bond formation protein DsbB